MVLLAGVAGAGLPSVASAQDREVYQFDLPAQDLGDALWAVAARAGWELYAFADDINGIEAPRLQGVLTARQAIEQLLAGTNLSVRFAKGAVIIRGRSETAKLAGSGAESDDIVVTGSRVRGAPSISPMTTVNREDAERSGQSDLGQVIRDLPQNFSGGQNPTIAGGGQGGFTNVSASSTINLRGLGPDATLTLFNGHRVAFDAISQGIDISAIPLAAIERVDIVADGASALYGSDAVAGVANIILRRDFDGLTTSARLGTATDGGAVTQQYDAVTGRKWQTGGLMTAVDYQRSTQITAGQRSYTANIYPTYTKARRG
jgi:outer membrane receptor for ferrienterochelin and colicin